MGAVSTGDGPTEHPPPPPSSAGPPGWHLSPCTAPLQRANPAGHPRRRKRRRRRTKRRGRQKGWQKAAEQERCRHGEARLSAREREQKSVAQDVCFAVSRL